jgi:hypothetical protein
MARAFIEDGSFMPSNSSYGITRDPNVRAKVVWLYTEELLSMDSISAAFKERQIIISPNSVRRILREEEVPIRPKGGDTTLGARRAGPPRPR